MCVSSRGYANRSEPRHSQQKKKTKKKKTPQKGAFYKLLLPVPPKNTDSVNYQTRLVLMSLKSQLLSNIRTYRP